MPLLCGVVAFIVVVDDDDGSVTDGFYVKSNYIITVIMALIGLTILSIKKNVPCCEFISSKQGTAHQQ